MTGAPAGSDGGDRTLARLARAAVALVWLYHGLWAKLLGGRPEQAAIVAGLPGLDAARADFVLMAVGLFEVVLALWVLSARAPAAAAWCQTAALVAMNAGGLAFGRASIADPGGMVVINAAFLVLVWRVARDARAQR